MVATAAKKGFEEAEVNRQLDVIFFKELYTRQKSVSKMTIRRVVYPILAKLTLKKKNLKWQTILHIVTKTFTQKINIFYEIKETKCRMCTWTFLVHQESLLK